MHDVGYNRISEVYFAMCKSVDTPVSLGLWLRFKYREHEQLANFSIRPEWYCTAYDFHRDYIVSELLSKYKGLKMNIDTKKVALQKFATSEDTCRLTNQRLRESRIRGYSPRVDAVMFIARRKIASLIGPRNDKWLDLCKWGPGATFSLRGEDANLDNKIRENQISITTTAIPYFRRVISDDYHWLRSRGINADGPVCLLNNSFNVVRGCKVTTVSKSAKTDRTIAIEPTANQFLQGGVGAYIRKRLLRAGIDLSSQEYNQEGARLAYANEMATVDLASASDTISRELIYDLLPLDWAFLLDDLRSKEYKLGTTWTSFEKISSMGNGFTFELETLIFWAITKACCEVSNLDARILVYGDDIIAPVGVLPLLREVFSFCGFSINMEKTHFDTPFRESCGKHFFGGFDVTPIYQKEVPDVLEEIYRLANRIRRLAYRMGAHRYCDALLRSAWLASTRQIKVLHVVPLDSQDDDGLALPWSELMPFASSLTQGGAKLPVLSFRARQHSLEDHAGLLAYWLRFTPSEPFDGRVAVRRRGRYVSRRRRYLVEGRDAAWV